MIRKAPSLTDRAGVGNSLYGVAFHTALKAKAMAAKRRAKEANAERLELSAARDPLLELLDEELMRLPEKYRLPVVLCELEGRSRREAAEALGVPERGPFRADWRPRPGNCALVQHDAPGTHRYSVPPVGRRLSFNPKTKCVDYKFGGTTLFGRYELSGDTLKICCAIEGEERPKAIEASKFTFIWTFGRAK